MNREVSSENELLCRSVRKSGSGFIVTDKSGRILLSNPSAQRILNCDFAIKGLNISEVTNNGISVSPSLREREGRFIVPLGSHERIIEYSLEFLPQDDAYFILLRDVTRTEDLEKRRLDLQQLSTMEKMARKLSHEIRDPLAVIFAGLQLLETSSSLNRGDVENLRFVLEAARSVVAVVNRFSEVLMPVEDAPSRINVAKLLAECAGHFDASASSKGIQLRRVAGPETWILGHEAAITRAMSHIVLNALEACKSGDTITIGHRTIDRSKISSVLPGYSGSVVGIFVQDTGPGLSADLTVTSVFRPFVTTKKKAMGLGLAAARDIVECHGGVISFSSWIPGATVLEILLPTADRPHCRHISNPHHARDCHTCEVRYGEDPQFCWAIKGREYRTRTGSWCPECLECEYFKSHNLGLYFDQKSDSERLR
ncbi:two-component system sensor histidine kinase NtrB [Desulfomonile tiedjei]|uniref:histidine kinase n=1 Tax=Desulfomonile tiedjei (strain ATCC 49306 / DSM 6799 / DCB-1) TaxID=706587 RepID=I4C393_DESTA|nr:ATP-binding protein [Desulfomonile tiedjei]AFM24034.1 signal transduction histidine kinase, nitrogen specific [Desulfomonile tiedjei DSM 6799]